jgi:tetratricopeptide (TPR) repeat protein
MTVLLLAAAASGGETANEAQARVLSDKGLAYFKLGDYDLAIAAFKQSYELAHAPGLLYNLAQSYRLKGDCRQALRLYRTYLRELPAAPNQRKVEDRIAEMERCAATGNSTLPNPSAGAADALPEAGVPPTAPRAEPPTPTAPRAEPPTPNPPTPNLPAPTAPRAEPTTPTAPRVETVAPPAPQIEAHASAAPSNARRRRVTALALVASGVVVAAAGIYFSVAVADDSRQIAADFTTRHSWTPADQTIETRAHDYTVAEGIFYGVGAAAAITGVILYAVGARHESSRVAAAPGGLAVHF